jgi:hypothetical protein
MTSTLPPYPSPSEGRPDDEGGTDWRQLLSRLVIVGVLALFLALLLFALAGVLTLGQIMRIFKWR